MPAITYLLFMKEIVVDMLQVSITSLSGVEVPLMRCHLEVRAGIGNVARVPEISPILFMKDMKWSHVH